MCFYFNIPVFLGIALVSNLFSQMLPGILKPSANSEPLRTYCNLSIKIHRFHSWIHPITNLKFKTHQPTILSKSVDNYLIAYKLPSL